MYGSQTNLKKGIQSTERNVIPPTSAPQREVIPMNKPQSPIVLKAPDVWVKKWVDYSSKYGLGYLLSNNQTGVFFNDSTKVILDNTVSTNFENS